MIRATLEEAAFELYHDQPKKLDSLDGVMLDVVQRAWGVFPYQQHSIRQVALALKIPRSTAYYHYRKALKVLAKKDKTS